MNKISAVQMAARLLMAGAMGLLSLSANAVELVGKPVAVGKPVVAASSAASSLANSVANQAVAASAQNLVPAVAPTAPEPPAEPLPPPVDLHEDNNPFNNGGNPFEHPFDEQSNWASPELLIPVVAMSLLFGGPVILVIVLSLLYYRAKARRLQNINANIDKLLAAGRDIPIELLMGEEAPLVKTTQPNGAAQVTYPAAEEMMRKGVRNIGLGVGWLLFLTIMFSFKIGSFGFILIGLGVSQVVIWWLSSSRRAEAAGFVAPHYGASNPTNNAERIEG